jgi:hypothetical protein
MAAIICVTVVLPLLPVTAISGRLFLARQAPASCISAWRVSATCRPGRASVASGCCDTTATAPAAKACGRKSWASKRSPCSATNRSPRCRVRVSVCTRPKRSCGSPTRVQVRPRARSASKASPRVQFISPPARSAPRAPARGRRRAGAHRPPPGSPRGPCRRSAARPRGAAPITAWRMAWARSAMRSKRPSMPAAMSSRMRSGSSLRGLSLVSSSASAPRAAAAPINGRLLRSRSPPQPNTTHSRPARAAASGRSAASALSRASGVCA